MMLESNKMSMDSERSKIESAVESLNIFENCILQLKKEMPTYFSRRTELSKSFKKFVKAFKNIASHEGDVKLQRTLFHCAQQYEKVDIDHSSIYKSNEEKTLQILEDARTMIVAPYREILADLTTAQKTAISPNKDHADRVIPVHSAMFDSHRKKVFIKILKNFLEAEIRYHCAVIEELSPSLVHINSLLEEDATI